MDKLQTVADLPDNPLAEESVQVYCESHAVDLHASHFTLVCVIHADPQAAQHCNCTDWWASMGSTVTCSDGHATCSLVDGQAGSAVCGGFHEHALLLAAQRRSQQ